MAALHNSMWLITVALGVSLATSAVTAHDDGTMDVDALPSAACAPVPEHVIAQHNLTEAERAAIGDVCWWSDSSHTGDGLLQTRNTIPPGVQCDPYTWYCALCRFAGLHTHTTHCRCDGDNVCSIVCKRGTVQIEPWLKHAIKTQVSQQCVPMHNCSTAFPPDPTGAAGAAVHGHPARHAQHGNHPCRRLRQP